MLLNCGAGEDSLDSPLGWKEIKPVNPKGNRPWLFTGKTDAESEAPILWPPDGKGWLTAKDPDAGKDWRQKEKWVAEDEMVRYHHWLNGHEFEQPLGDTEGQGSLAWCSHEVAESWTWLSDWITRKFLVCEKSSMGIILRQIYSSDAHGDFLHLLTRNWLIAAMSLILFSLLTIDGP